jgi:SHS family lactate transporter-like MFS transporter
MAVADAAPTGRTPLTPDQRNAFVAALLGWTMDAFDYFIVVLVYADIATSFGKSKETVAFLTTATLLMRPIGALLFGLWADRIGRRTPLIVDVLFYSTVGFLCAFAPNFTVLLVLRFLYGIGMGGEWGLGAALAMEKIPRERRVLLGVAAAGIQRRLSAGSRGVPAAQRRLGSRMAVAVRGLDPSGDGQPLRADQGR